MLKNILFDLDGTLINTDQDKFNHLFFALIIKNFSSLGYDGEKIGKLVFKGLTAMENNDGHISNKEAFISCIKKEIDISEERLFEIYDDFYNNEYNMLKECVTKEEKALSAIKILKEKGYNLIISTNPLFPRIALTKRMLWGGLNPEDFSYLTDYENSCYSKPSKEYYEEILKKNNCKKEETMMFGNDAWRDASIELINVPCFIITNHLCSEEYIDKCKIKGDYNEFYNFILNLPKIN